MYVCMYVHFTRPKMHTCLEYFRSQSRSKAIGWDFNNAASFVLCYTKHSAHRGHCSFFLHFKGFGGFGAYFGAVPISSHLFHAVMDISFALHRSLAAKRENFSGSCDRVLKNIGFPLMNRLVV